ncbi:lipopolysaccharide assembly protein LapB [Frateuria aurantia]
MSWMLLSLAVPLAFAAGWWCARRWPGPSPVTRSEALSSDYFRGLNYLLNEEQDKAIEVFLRLAEYNRDAVETHLALGSLFRRRGEVDRAIRLHQHLVSRPGLSNEVKTLGLMELGDDYMRAGLLDRAESLFSDLVALQAHAPTALRQLIGIYQHERDWNKAIEQARLLERATGESEAILIAQFYCELADQYRLQGHIETARGYIRQAFENDPNCIRALLASAVMDASEQKYTAAIRDYQQALSVDLAFVPQVLPPLQSAYAHVDSQAEAARFYDGLLERYQGISLVLARVELYRQMEGEAEAQQFLTRQLRARPTVRGLMALIDATMERLDGEILANFTILHDLMRKLLEGQMMYRCTRCGFGAKAHHWQCPSCKSWSTIRPILGVANE